MRRPQVARLPRRRIPRRVATPRLFASSGAELNRARPAPLISVLILVLLAGFTNCDSAFRAIKSGAQLSVTEVPPPQAACISPSPCPVTKIATPSFRTEVIMFEDNFRFQPAAGAADLIYRREGVSQVARSANSLTFQGIGGFIHPAQYRKATLRLRLAIAAGEPEIAFAHNGLSDNSGAPNPTPGFKIVFKADSTDIVDIATNAPVASLRDAAPRSSAEFVFAIAWDVESRTVRLDFPAASYAMTMAAAIPEGGFALRSSRADTSFQVKKLSVVWQDDRRLVLYDEYDTLRNLDGTVLQTIPSAKLPVGMTAYVTAAIDLKKARSFIFFGGNDLNLDIKATIRGFAVRDLATGNLDVFPAPINGCYPLQGGGGLDGHAILQSWTPPASLCWLDWNAYDRGDRANFVVPAAGFQASGAQGGAFVGYHDSSLALDGSMFRYIRVPETLLSVTHFSVHPKLARFASFVDQTVPQAPNQQSQTGPGVLPTELVVRDSDRAWYELWAYTSTNLHTQMRGYNVFSNSDDWAGPAYPAMAPAAPYTDYANTVPSLTEPGKLWAPLIRWTPVVGAPGTLDGVSLHYLSVGTNSFLSERTIPQMPVNSHSPIQLLWP